MEADYNSFIIPSHLEVYEFNDIELKTKFDILEYIINNNIETIYKTKRLEEIKDIIEAEIIDRKRVIVNTLNIQKELNEWKDAVKEYNNVGNITENKV